MLRNSHLGIILLFMIAVNSQSQNQCTNPSATPYDSFLESQISYAQFNGNSNLRFRNPFQGISMLSEGTIMMWARLPMSSGVGSTIQQGRLFDCGDMLSARINGTSITVNVSLTVTAINGITSVVRQTLSAVNITTSPQTLMQWNHIAISVKNKLLALYFNGHLINQLALNQTYIMVNTDYCVIGNSLNNIDPFNGHMRHLAFMSQGFNSSTAANLSALLHTILIPNNPTVQAYFKFDGSFVDSYTYNTTRNYTWANLTMSSSSEPENVCYCTISQQVLLLAQASSLQALAVTSNASQPFGLTMKMWTNMYTSAVGASETVIVNVANYFSLVLVLNQVASLRVDLYNGTDQTLTKLNINGFKPAFNTWTLYELQITTSQIVLSINGGLSQYSVNHSVPLATPSSLSVLSSPVNAVQMLIASLSLFEHQVDNIAPAQINAVISIGDVLYPGNSISVDETLYNQLAVFSFSQASQTTSNFTSSDGTMQWAGSNFTFATQSRDYCSQQSVNILFDGISCKSQKQAVDITQNTQLQGMFQSYSAPSMTVDLWFNATNSETSNNSQVLFANYDMNNKALVVIQINQANIYCSLGADNVSLPLTSVRQWHHISCVISNGQSLQIIEHDTTLSLSSQGSILLTSQMPTFGTNTTFLTILGNSIAGNNQMQGLVRDVRVLNQAISFQQMETLRYLRLSSNTWSGLNLKSFEPLSEYNKDLSSLALVPDSSLIVCPVNTLFDGSCCVQTSITNITVNITQQETSNGFLLLTANVTGLPQNIQGLTIFNWALTTITSLLSDPSQISNKVQISQYLLNQTGPFISIPQSMIFFNSSYGFTVAVSTPIHGATLYYSYNLALSCPRGFINNMTNPIIYQWGYETPLTLTTQTVLSCYSLPTALTVKSILWTNNNTGTALVPYTVSTDSSFWQLFFPTTIANTNITFNLPALIPFNSTLKVTYSVTFSNGLVLNDSRIIQFLQKSVVLNIASADSTGTIYLSYGNDLIIDASQTQFLSNTIPLAQMAYNLTTNSSIVNSANLLFNQSTGIFRVPWSQLVYAIANFNYTFNVTAGKPGSAYATASKLIKVVWYIPQLPSQKNCPGLYPGTQTSNFVLKPTIKQYVYSPNFLINCTAPDGINRTLFSSSNIQYSIDTARVKLLFAQTNQFVNISLLFNDTFNVNSSGYMITFKNTSVMSRLNFGDIIPIFVKSSFTDMKNNTTNDTLSVDITIQSSQIVIISNTSIGIPQQGLRPVNYEEILILSAAMSYDPDYSTYTNGTLTSPNSSVLSFQYICNNQTCQFDPSQMAKGILTISPLDRIKLGYSYNTSMLFQIIATNPLVPSKPSQIAAFNITFLGPTQIATSSCPTPSFTSQYGSSSDSLSTGYTFDLLNVTDLTLLLTTNSCFNLIYQIAYILISVPVLGGTADGVISYQLKNVPTASLTFPRSNLTSTISVNQSITLNALVVYNYTAGATQKIGYSPISFTINRILTPLQPTINLVQNIGVGSQYTIGQEETVDMQTTIQSDYEPIQSSYISSVYQCSPNINLTWCNNIQNLTIFSLTKAQRTQSGINTVGSQFWISVTLVAIKRTSQIFNISMTIADQDYSKCIVQYNKLTYFVTNIAALAYPFVFRPVLSYFCDDSSTWLQNSGLIWSSNSQTPNNYLTSESVQSTNFQVAVLPSDLALAFQQNQEFQVTGDATFTTDFVTGQNLTGLASFSITLVPSTTPVLSLTKIQWVDFNSTDPLTFTATLVPYQSGDITCIFTCNFGGFIQDCSQNTTFAVDYNGYSQCSIDLLNASLPYEQQIQSQGAYSSVQVNATTSDGSVYQSTVQVLNYIDNSTQAPQCFIYNTNNSLFLLDQQIILTCNCTGLMSSDISYQWAINNQTNPSLFAFGDIMQTINIVPGAFYGLQSIQVSVVTSYKNDSTLNSTTQMIIQVQPTSQINQGVVNVVQISQNALFAFVQIIIFNQKQHNGLQLFNSISYKSPSGDTVTLVSKSIETSFQTLIPLSITNLTLTTFDNNGAYIYSTFHQSVTQNFSQQTNIPLSSYAPPSSSINSPSVLQLSAYSLNLATLNNSFSDAEKWTYGSRALEYVAAYSLSGNFTRALPAMKNSLSSSLGSVNNCFDVLLANATLDIVQNLLYSGDWLNGQLGPISFKIIDVYNSVLLKLSTTVYTNDFIASELTNGQTAITENMQNGQTIIQATQGIAIQKIVIGQMASEQKIQVNNGQVSFTLDPQLFGKLSLDQGFVKVQKLANYQQSSDTSLSLIGDVIDITIEDLNLNTISTSNIPVTANISFNSVPIQQGFNIQCGFFNTSANSWILGANGGLTTYVDTSSNSVTCKTNHLSQFSIFNITVLSPEPPSAIISTVSMSEYNQRVSVSVIELAFIVISLVMFVLQCIRESQKKQTIMEQYDFTQLEDKLTFCEVFKSFSPLFSLFQQTQFHILQKIMVLLNYLLAISLFALSFLAILDPQYVTPGDVVWLIVSICLVFMFASPLLKELLTYSHVTFTPVNKFSELFKVKDEPKSRKAAYLVPGEDYPEKPADLEGQKFSQTPQTVWELEEETKSNPIKDFEGLPAIDKYITKDGKRMSYSDHDTLNRQSSGNQLIVEQADIKGHNSEKEYIFESSSPSQEKNTQTISLDVTLKKFHKSNHSKSPSIAQNLKDADISSDEQHIDLHFEGGEDEAKQDGPAARVKDNKFKTKEQYMETVLLSNTITILLQVLTFLIVGGIDIFLFIWVDITGANQYSAYISSLILCSAFLFIVFDTLVSFIALLSIKNHGIIEAKIISSSFVFGFIGFNRLRCLQ